MTRFRTPFLAAALLAGVAAVGLTPALAQTAAPPAGPGAGPGEARQQDRARMMPGEFVEGRIAFLKAQLKITPAQEEQWRRVEAAMRENAKARDQAITTMRQARQDRGAMNAVERLELRGQMAKVRAESNDRFLAAFKPLYASLSPEQQSMADRLIAAGNKHRRGHHRA
jgi:Spy/CpxP family protein refolding chaperone